MQKSETKNDTYTTDIQLCSDDIFQTDPHYGCCNDCFNKEGRYLKVTQAAKYKGNTVGNGKDSYLAQKWTNFIGKKEKSQNKQNVVQSFWDYMLNTLLNCRPDCGREV